jgi:hypothetical protein
MCGLPEHTDTEAFVTVAIPPGLDVELRAAFEAPREAALRD